MSNKKKSVEEEDIAFFISIINSKSESIACVWANRNQYKKFTRDFKCKWNVNSFFIINVRQSNNWTLPDHNSVDFLSTYIYIRKRIRTKQCKWIGIHFDWTIVIYLSDLIGAFHGVSFALWINCCVIWLTKCQRWRWFCFLFLLFVSNCFDSTDELYVSLTLSIPTL